jgi:biopolymer transport protein TolR
MDAGRNNNSRSPLSQINVTPLVDVMLVLLIIFMVTASMGQQGVKVDLPKTTKAKVLVMSEEMIIVSLKKDLSVYINNDRIETKELEGRLKEIYSKRSNKEIFIKADKDVPYGEFAKVISIIKFAGVEKLGMVTEVQEKS